MTAKMCVLLDDASSCLLSGRIWFLYVRAASMYILAKLCKEMLWVAHCARSQNDVESASSILNGMTRVLITNEGRGLLLYLPHKQLQSALCCVAVVCAAVILAFLVYGWQVLLSFLADGIVNELVELCQAQLIPWGTKAGALSCFVIIQQLMSTGHSSTLKGLILVTEMQFCRLCQTRPEISGDKQIARRSIPSLLGCIPSGNTEI